MIPPLITVGSSSAASNSEATIDVVVVLPCVPPTATAHFSLINSPSISARRTMGKEAVRAATTSGLSFLTADEITTTLAVPIFSALCPMLTAIPLSRKRLTLALSL